ncbi:MAG: hypothetical protein JRE23_00145 [Deltaproteobacteria bacterium]|nr:hypothetical protein [Deltaproteobacteria bacterium]
MDEWSGKESYEGYFKKTERTIMDLLTGGIEKLKAAGLDIEARPGYYLWAIDNVPEQKQEEQTLLDRLGKMWFEGEASTSFNDKDFESYQEVVREWGSVTNKIYNRYFKAMENLLETQGEPVKTGQMSLDGLPPKDGQVGVGF